MDGHVDCTMDAENWRLNMKLNKRICPKSFVVNGDRLVTTGNTREAAKEVNEGLKYYSNKVINALNPYAAADAGIIVIVLRHLANEIEKKNPGAKELAKWLESHTEKPELKERTVIKK